MQLWAPEGFSVRIFSVAGSGNSSLKVLEPRQCGGHFVCGQYILTYLKVKRNGRIPPSTGLVEESSCFYSLPRLSRVVARLRLRIVTLALEDFFVFRWQGDLRVTLLLMDHTRGLGAFKWRDISRKHLCREGVVLVHYNDLVEAEASFWASYVPSQTNEAEKLILMFARWMCNCPYVQSDCHSR